jgi:hypothetical protein
MCSGVQVSMYMCACIEWMHVSIIYYLTHVKVHLQEGLSVI